MDHQKYSLNVALNVYIKRFSSLQIKFYDKFKIPLNEEKEKPKTNITIYLLKQ
jgi:hypothetical protein